MMAVGDYVSAELLVIIGTVILLSLLLAEMCDWTRLLFTYDNPLCNYSYNEIGGPLTWKERFPQSKGELQSPINIVSSFAVVLPSETLPPLKFSAEYHLPPKDFRVYNDGHCVTIYARWSNDVRPVICGGPLRHPYQFFNARFRWGPNDEEGSEHTIDSERFAMELQVTHIKENGKYTDLKQASEDNAVLILSYFFQVGPVDNPYLKSLTSALKKIQCPFNCTSLEPAPLSCLFPPFFCKYFTYNGSLTFPPCTEGVQWMIQPEPLGISSRQVRKFRKLCAVDGPIDLNTRPVQELNCRDIYFYE
ncbi:hypothetical protein ILUMI_25727 [Ignelater luminosus]|uniref:Alpha-carbonic anhydrase domain-containing protein n=1 Tax=Ignelater luminosus TaxID=2038154 RepID=A0A8K0C553_IGNLU|nr:hypothetical protein ILUMI_25727 [Ignelater luminosus]